MRYHRRESRLVTRGFAKVEGQAIAHATIVGLINATDAGHRWRCPGCPRAAAARHEIDPVTVIKASRTAPNGIWHWTVKCGTCSLLAGPPMTRFGRYARLLSAFGPGAATGPPSGLAANREKRSWPERTEHDKDSRKEMCRNQDPCGKT